MAYLFTRAQAQMLKMAHSGPSAHPYTMAFWGRSVSDVQGVGLYMGVDGGAQLPTYDLKFAGDKPGDPVEFYETNGPFSESADESDTGVTVGQWHLALGRKTAANSRAAGIDGVMSGATGGIVGTSAVASVAVGNRNSTAGAGDFHFDGALAACALWEVALSNAEIAQLGAGVDPWTVRHRDLVFYWPATAAYGFRDAVSGSDLTVIGPEPPLADDPPQLLRVGVHRRGRRGNFAHRMTRRYRR